jgi:hypothetical protein
VHRGQVFPVVERNTEKTVRYSVTVGAEQPAWIFTTEARAFNIDPLPLITNKIETGIAIRHFLNVLKHVGKYSFSDVHTKIQSTFFILVVWAGSSLTFCFCANRFRFFLIRVVPSALSFTLTLFTDAPIPFLMK